MFGRGRKKTSSEPYSLPTDDSLIRRPDDSEFSRKYLDWLVKYAEKVAHRHSPAADPEEVAQKAMVNIWMRLKLEVHPPKFRFRDFLKKIVRNEFVNEYRIATRNGKVQQMKSEDLDALPGSDDVEQELFAAWRIEVLEVAISRIKNANHRRAVEERLWSASKPGDIAQLLNVSPDLAQKYGSRGLKELGRILKSEFGLTLNELNEI